MYSKYLRLAAISIRGCRAANAEATLPGMAVEFEGWKYIPVFEDGEVQSFVILADDPDPMSANIASMWFKRNGSSWAGYSWRTSDQKDTLTAVKETLGLSDETDSYWPVEPEVRPDGNPAITTTEPFATGLFYDDPLLPIVEEQQDPTVLLSVLVSEGWQAADAVLFSSECRLNQLLNGLADGFILGLFEDGPGLETIYAAIDDIAEECQVSNDGGSCPPSTVYGPVFASGCIDTTGWVLVSTNVGQTAGQCYPENCWEGSFFNYERRKVIRTYSDCSTCDTVQVRYNDCTTSVCELDIDTPQALHHAVVL